MSDLTHRAGVTLTFVGIVALAAGALAYDSGARINTTKSIPRGLYWTSADPVGKGAYVLFCPPQAGVFAEAKARGYLAAGFCPGDYGYLMKKVLAAKGDTVSVTAEGVLVNGELLPQSAPRAVDGAGRPMPRYQADRYTLGDNEVLLMSDASATSFDARYFGPVTRSHIETVIKPVFTW